MISFWGSGHSTLVGCVKAILTIVQEHLENNSEIKNTFEITLVQENLGGRPDAARPPADVLGSVFEPEIS